jgi:hypothetical protein
MKKSLNIKGQWWLPNNPENKVFGTLEYSESGSSKLELFGGLELTTEPILIVGESSNGDKYSLNDCHVNNFQTGTSGFSTVVYSVSEIFENAHFDSPEEIAFQAISIQYTNTTEWSRLSALKIEQEFFEAKFSLDFDLPEPKTVEFETGSELSLELYSRYPQFLREVSSKIEIQQFPVFTFRFSRTKNFEELQLEYIRHLQNLLTLAITQPVSVEFIIGHLIHPGFDSKSKEKNRPVNIYLDRKNYFKNDRDVIFQNMLFTFPAVEKEWKSLLSNWFKKRDRLEPIVTLYFSTLYNSYLYLENNFLSLVQAVESYHRRTFETKEFEEEEKNTLIEQVLNAIDSKYHKVITRKLNYIHEPSLRTRLKEIFDEHRSVLDKYIRRKQFCDKAYVSRNYYTHYDEDLKEQVDKIDLIDLINKLEIVIEVCLLKELGFSLKEIEECLQNRGDHKIRMQRKENT